MNRRVIALITAAFIALTLTACGKTNRDEKSDDTVWEETTDRTDTGNAEDDFDDDLVTEPSDETTEPSTSPDDPDKPSTSPEPAEPPKPSVSPSPSQKPSQTQKPVQTQKPSESQEPGTAPTKSPAATASPAPSKTPAITPNPTVSPQPTQTPALSPTPNPTVTPTPEPSKSPETPPEQDIDVRAIMDSILNEMGNPQMLEVEQDMLKEVYYIDPSILESYCAMMPFFNISATEIAIFEVKDEESMDAVMQGIKKRIDKLLEMWESYLPSQYELVKNHKIQKNGNFVIMIIANDQQKLLDIFNSYFK